VFNRLWIIFIWRLSNFLTDNLHMASYLLKEHAAKDNYIRAYLSPNFATWGERWIADWFDTRKVFMQEPVFLLITWFSNYWPHNLPSILSNLLCSKQKGLLNTVSLTWHHTPNANLCNGAFCIIMGLTAGQYPAFCTYIAV